MNDALMSVRRAPAADLRADAIRFYESLGFAARHEGLKLKL